MILDIVCSYCNKKMKSSALSIRNSKGQVIDICADCLYNLFKPQDNKNISNKEICSVCKKEKDVNKKCWWCGN